MITQKYIKQYIETNYGQLRHCPKALKNALNKTAKETNLNAQSLFHLLIENEPITAPTPIATASILDMAVT